MSADNKPNYLVDRSERVKTSLFQTGTSGGNTAN